MKKENNFNKVKKPKLTGLRKGSDILFLEEVVTSLKESKRLQKEGYQEVTCFAWVRYSGMPHEIGEPHVIGIQDISCILDYELIAPAYLIEGKIATYLVNTTK